MRKIIFAAVAVSLPVIAFADEATETVMKRQDNMKARGAQMSLLGKMAKGEVDYDPAKAQEAAQMLLDIFSVDMSGFWVGGTSSEDLPGVSYALPALWENGAEVEEIGKATYSAVQNLAQIAGNDLGQLRAGLGPVAKGCQDCHKIGQAKKN